MTTPAPATLLPCLSPSPACAQGLGMFIDRHKYRDGDATALKDMHLVQTLTEIYSREAPSFLLDKGFPQEVRTPAQK